MKKNVFRIGLSDRWLILFVSVFIAAALPGGKGQAENVTITSPAVLQAALGGASAASLDGKTVTLLQDVNIGTKTLHFTGGDIVFNLNGHRLTMDKTGVKEDATCIDVNGSSASLLLMGRTPGRETQGEIVVKAAKGVDGGWNKKGGKGYNALGVVLNNGRVKIKDVSLSMTPGAGGDGQNFWGSSNPGDPGTGYIIDPNGSHTLSEMIADGYVIWKDNAVFTNVTNAEVAVEGNSASVEAVTYQVAYEKEGGTITSSGYTTSYTAETTPFLLPAIEKAGYDFKGWFCGNDRVGDALYLPRPDVLTKNLTFTAKWEICNYSIAYELNGGANAAENPTGYTVETETFTLADPSRPGYRFLGWFEKADFSGAAVPSVPKGSTGDRTFYARWSKIYSLAYEPNGGTMPGNPPAVYIVEDTPLDLPVPVKANCTFMGWCEQSDLSGEAVKKLAENTTGDKMYYAKWLETFRITCHWYHPTVTIADKVIPYTKESVVVLPAGVERSGYKVTGWYDNPALTGTPVVSLPAGTAEDKEFYGKWAPVVYTISYEAYHGTVPSSAPSSYTVESEDVDLPFPVRSGFTFVGWYATDELKEPVEAVKKGSTGNKVFYAKWTAGNRVNFIQPSGGSIMVLNGTEPVETGGYVGGGTQLTVKAEPAEAGFRLTKLVINGTVYTESPQTVQMPADGGLTVSAEFDDPRPAVSAPLIETNPKATDFLPSGETVVVTLKKTDEASELYYSIDGAAEQPYTGPFNVSSLTGDRKTLHIVAYARKAGCKDGVAERDLIFRNGKIFLTFQLPKGIAALDPEGGEVVSAVANGGTFRFILQVDPNYFHSLDTLQVTANGTPVSADVYGVYTLAEQKGDVVVKVSGVSGVTYTFALIQTEHGRIYFTDDEGAATLTVNYGDRVSVTAEPHEDYKFAGWEDGSQENPRMVTADRNRNIQARFVFFDESYTVTLPVLEGVTVKPLTGYPTEVKKGGKFKCYLRIDEDYDESTPVVRANGEVIEVYQDVYALYNIQGNVSLSVSGIEPNRLSFPASARVVATSLATGEPVNGRAVLPDEMLVLHAKAPEGKVFGGWNDGKTDNPRIVAARAALQLVPFFDERGAGETGRLVLPVLAGAGLGVVNGDADAVAKGGEARLKLVVLPSHSRSGVQVSAGGRVLMPERSLRSSAETATYFYSLPEVSGETVVEVSGLEVNRYDFAVAQQAGGRVEASRTGRLEHGTAVTLRAVPAKGYVFVKWSDGNTLNPYPYKVTSDRTVSGFFLPADSPVGNEAVLPAGVRLYAADGWLRLETERPGVWRIWDVSGRLIRNEEVGAGQAACRLDAGVYIVQFGGGKAVKVSVK